MLKNLLSSFALLTILSLVTSCSTTDPEDYGVVEMSSTIENESVTQTVKGSGEAIEGGTSIDEVRIDRVRVLLSRLKFKRSSDDTSNGGIDVKTGPAVALFEPGVATLIFEQAIPNGTYDRVKLEKHKFSSSEADDYVGHAVFGDFVEPDRVTLIIEGVTISGSETTPFEVRDDATENLWIDFIPSLEVNSDTEAELDLVFDGLEVFKDGAVLLDPNQSGDLDKIRKNLKDAFRIQNRD